MPKAMAVTTAERAYLERRLAPLLAALRTDENLREEFLLFVRARGGGLTLTIDRLKTVWWPSRKSMYPGFFVLALVEFGLAHGLFAAEKKPRAGRR
jgi:ABC-type phosphate transport system auxiliary subunit